MPKQPTPRLIALDPGDKHVGVALFERRPDTLLRWACIVAYEMGPTEAVDSLADMLRDGDLDTIVYERFALYLDKAAEQAGSTMETAQMIGVIRYLHRTLADHTKVALVEQPASIKKPTRSLVKRRGIKPVAPKTAGDHARDSELHGWSWILRGQ
jgi:RNase H-fold protein (predicted Holliday junction resolvase)